ncbi:hypothetical protein RHMOL_Rhmol02G0044800 [Rhododendron molle]|uniref:Uncharacterized protein n=1 Tax=Rhododendron molle TaxID=49168 RepID=A0ACC0PL86_RHOML|nr:hypothetical protein RHMOL_Rhmol02G0044800 [Rhododendron molle]
MAAPMNSGESDMVTEDFLLTFSPLLSPRWSQLCLTPSPPRSFLPSSSSMVGQYQGSNQSMDDPPQNQEHNDIVDPAPYLAGDSALLQQQQQLRKNWSEVSDWRPRGGGIMRMNNQGFEESNIGFEESMKMTTCFYFPPSPTYFPLYRPMPSVFFVSSEQKNISLALSSYMLEDKGGALHVVNGEDGEDIFDLLHDDLKSYVDNKFGDLNQIAVAAGVVPKDMESFVDNIRDAVFDEREVTLRRINWFEQHDEAIVGQPVYEQVGVVHQLIQNRGGELDVIIGGGVFTVNGLERRDSQGLPMTPETLLICQAKGSIRVWVGHGGQWTAEFRYRCNRLNIGIFSTVEDAISGYELVTRWSGLTDSTSFPRLFENENRSKLPLQLPLPAQELNQVEDFGLVCCNGTRNDEIESVGTSSEGTGECAMADKARLNSVCLGKRKTKEKNPGGEKRNKKTNGVRVAIPLEKILQTKGMRRKDAAKHLKVSITKLKSSCREYGIQRWPPRNEHMLIKQSLPNATPVVVDQEGIPHLTSDTVSSNQALTATVDTNNFFEKEILLPQLLPTAQQENPDVGFGNDEDEAIGMEVAGTMEGVMVQAQLSSGCSGNGKWKEKSPGGERGKDGTTGVKIAIAKEDILQTKDMRLKDAAKHLEVSRSTFKRACREHGIKRWPPRKERELISQSHSNEFSAVVDQERTPQLNSDALLPSAQVSATVGTNIVTIRAGYGEVRIKFRLSWPWRMVELEQEVKKRLPLEAGTYYIKYKDEDDGLMTLIACDEDLEDYISSSSRLGTPPVEQQIQRKTNQDPLDEFVYASLSERRRWRKRGKRQWWSNKSLKPFHPPPISVALSSLVAARPFQKFHRGERRKPANGNGSFKVGGGIGLNGLAESFAEGQDENISQLIGF